MTTAAKKAAKKAAKRTATPARRQTTAPAKKTAKKTATRYRAPKEDRGVWLWPLYAMMRDVFIDAPPKQKISERWDDANVPNATRALLLLYIDGAQAIAAWPKNPEDPPPAPSWFRGWEDELARAQNAVDRSRPAWSTVTADGERKLNLYHLEIRTVPGEAFAQIQRARQKIRPEFVANLERLTQVSPTLVRPEKSGLHAELPVVDGRQRTRATRQRNLEKIRDWWLSFRTGPGPHRTMCMPLRLYVPCRLIHCDTGHAEDIGSSLNAHQSTFTRLQTIEEALRLRRKGRTIAQIQNDLDETKSTVANFLALANLEATLEPLLWTGDLPISVGYELAKIMPKSRQLSIWQAIADKPDKLAAFRRMTNAAMPAASLAQRMRAAHTAAKAAATPEGQLVRDFLTALHGDEETAARLPAEVRAFLGRGQVQAAPATEAAA